MHPQRQIGSTNVKVSSLGFGAAPIGNLYKSVASESASQAVQWALDAGIRYFDTAPYYGLGTSETRLGAALPVQTDAVVSSKVGRLLCPADSPSGESLRYGFACDDSLDVAFDYSFDGVMRSVEASLERIGRNRIDILLAHDLGRYQHGDGYSYYLKQFLEGGYKALAELRDQGVIGALGVGVNEKEICLELLAEVDLDCLLLAGRYTLLEQSPVNDLFPLCRERNVSVILGGVFNSGILATGTKTSAVLHYDYAPAPEIIIKRVSAIEVVCAAYGVPLAAAALQFSAAHPQVTSVVLGLASPAEVETAVAMHSFEIPQEFWQQLKSSGLIAAELPVPERNSQ